MTDPYCRRAALTAGMQGGKPALGVGPAQTVLHGGPQGQGSGSQTGERGEAFADVWGFF